MMKYIKQIFFLTVVLGLMTSASAGLKVLLTEASNDGTNVDAELKVVEKQLKRTKFTHFKFIGSSKEQDFPVKLNETFKGGISVSCEGPENNLKVIIKNNGKEISKQVLKIQKPFVIGVPVNGKNYLVILTK